MSESDCECYLKWYRVVTETIPRDNGKIELTLSVGVEPMEDPRFEVIIKSSGADWGLLSLDEVQAQWLTQIIYERFDRSLEQKDEDGEIFRYLAVKYKQLGRPFVKLIGMEKQHSPEEVDIPYECIKAFEEKLSGLLSLHRRMRLSLYSGGILERTQVEGIIDAFNEEQAEEGTVVVDLKVDDPDDDEIDSDIIKEIKLAESSGAAAQQEPI